MKPITLAVALLCAGLAAGEQLAPTEPGVPAEMGGEVTIEQRGSHIWLRARLPEAGGRVLARSAGRNPVWERDALESPPVEDRMRWVLSYKSAGGAARTVVLEVNPWGAYRIEEHEEALGNISIACTAEVTADGWNTECPVPLSDLDVDWSTPEVRISAERIRSRRALAPEFQWKAEFSALRIQKTDEGRPVESRQTEAALQIGRTLRLPSLDTDWEDPAWTGVPAFALPENQPNPRAPKYRTQVKWVHDGQRLALFARMEEPEPVVARSGGRDSSITSDDHIALYLATSGSSFLEIAVNSVGAIRDAQGIGPRLARTRTSWNAGIETKTEIRHGFWVARINVPLDECARALGESGLPRDWRILVGRYRASRPGEAGEWSTLPALGGTTTFYAPLRYRPITLSDSDPVAANLPALSRREDLSVWTPSYRRSHSMRTMVERYLEKKIEEAVLAERRAWDQVGSRSDWEQFRDQRIQALKESAGVFPSPRAPLDARITATHQGDGYRLENVIFQTRADYWMTANLYLPLNPKAPIPVIIIVHSQHFPKTQGELHDMGQLWARTGTAVLIAERPGYGERAETSPGYRLAYGSRFNFTKQLFLVGESYSGWAAWDVIRSVDFLYQRPEIDRQRIILIGSVAGGGEIAGVAAALDERITAVVPFNYDQGHVRVHGDSPGQIAKQFSPWLVAASIAPRKFVRAFEFGWEGAEEPDYPNLWVDGMERSKKVWGFYNAGDNLASSQAYGLIRLSMERVSHCFSVGPQQRKELYPIFQRWFQIPYPSAKDLAILPDSQLSVSPYRDEAQRQEAERRRPNTDLVSMTTAAAAQVKRKAMHQIAFEMGKQQLTTADRRRIREGLRPLLGDIEPTPTPRLEKQWTKAHADREIEAISLTVEDGIQVPLLLIRPQGKSKPPVVVAVAQAGKDRFLTDRSREIEALLRAGIAVCLPDVRATGETAPSSSRSDGGPFHSLAEMEFDLGRNLLGSRLKDLRTVLAYLRSRTDIDGQRLSLWGDSFSPANPPNLWVDELEYESGPQIQYRAEPMGAHLALLATLYEQGIQAVVANGGLASYLSVLENSFTYVPIEDIILGILKVGDIPDMAAALAPKPLLMQRLVNGRNIRFDPNTPDKDVAAWLISQMGRK